MMLLHCRPRPGAIPLTRVIEPRANGFSKSGFTICNTNKTVDFVYKVLSESSIHKAAFQYHILWLIQERRRKTFVVGPAITNRRKITTSPMPPYSCASLPQKSGYKHETRQCALVYGLEKNENVFSVARLSFLHCLKKFVQQHP